MYSEATAAVDTVTRFFHQNDIAAPDAVLPSSVVKCRLDTNV